MTDFSQKTRETVVKILIEKTNKFYILPEKASAFDAFARKKLEDGGYDSQDDRDNFSSVLTTDLQAIVGDRHLGVGYSLEAYEQILKYEQNPDDYEPNEEAQKKWIEQARYDNNGFKRVERLAGNVGYIRLDGFFDASYAGETAITAMNFVANCDALLFDLRKNGGGSPSMIQLISSYLFKNRTHLNNFYDRYDDKTTQFWTQEHVQGKKMPDIPVYVLTSNHTFSAAEEFTYNLKNLKRATIIGETTGGGGHPVTGMTLADGFLARICRARAVNPITQTNWEGVGVEPDIALPQAEALAKAHLHALETLVETSDSDEEKRKRQWEVDNAQAMYSDNTSEEFKRFEGRYGAYVIQAENGKLTYTVRGFPGQLTALTSHCFVNLERDSVHLEFATNDDGDMALTITFRDEDRQMTFPRSSA